MDLQICTICRNAATNPKNLPCLHHFCLDCIAEYCAKDDNYCPRTQSYKCPNCRDSFKLPPGGCVNLKTNVFIEKLAASSLPTQTNRPRLQESLCSKCEKNGGKETAITFCLECCVAMCQTCSKKHYVADDHKYGEKEAMFALDFNRRSAEGAARDCRTHAKPFEMFCEDCGELACVDCFFGRHKTHAVCKVDEAVEKVARGVNKAVDLLASHRGTLPDGVCPDDSIVAKIRKRADRLRKYLDDRESILIGRFNELKSSREKRLAVKALIENYHSFVRDQVDRANADNALVFVSSDILSNVEKVLRCVSSNALNVECPTFVESNVLMAEDCIGSFQASTSTKGGDNVNKNRDKEPPKEQSAQKYSLQHSSEIILPNLSKSSHVVVDVTTHNNCLYVTTKDTNQIIVYDHAGLEFIGVCKLGETSKLGQIISSGIFLFVLNNHDRQVIRLSINRNNIDNKIIEKFAPEVSVLDYRAMVICDTGNLAITGKIVEGNLVIFEMTQRLEVIRVIAINPTESSVDQCILLTAKYHTSYFTHKNNTIKEVDFSTCRDIPGRELSGIKGAHSLSVVGDNYLLCCEDKLVLLGRDLKVSANLHVASLGEKIAGCHVVSHSAVVYVFYRKSNKIDVFNLSSD